MSDQVVVDPIGGGPEAGDEWAGLVRAAVLGTDRHPPPPPRPGWDRWASAADPALQVLDRAAAVTVVRRAGIRPVPAVAGHLPAAPADHRRPCPATCRARLAALLGRGHDVLLAEWFALAEAHDVQLPWELLPQLLLRGRSRPELDHTVRRLAAGRDVWLATVVPSLGVRLRPGPPAPPSPLRPPSPPADSRAVVAGIVGVIAEGRATWAAAAELVHSVTAIDADALDALVAGLADVECPPVSERVRLELADLAATRLAMLREFSALGPRHSGAPPIADSSHTMSSDDRGDLHEPS